MEEYAKLWEKVKDIRVAMMTTFDDGILRSRPMHTQQAEFEGLLWFFTRDNSPKTEEIENKHQVNLAYADPGKNVWVSVSGTAQIVHDRKKMEELWNPALKAWVPDGLDDPHIGLIRVHATQAEYWDSSSNKLVQLVGLVKAVTTGEAHKGEGTDHAKLKL